MIVNFDAKVDQILNEANFFGTTAKILGGAAQATGSMAGSFIKGAQNPAYVGELTSKFAENRKKNKEKAIGKDNKPEIGDYVQYGRNTIGRVIKVSNGGANFEVILVGMAPLSKEDAAKLQKLDTKVFSVFNRRIRQSTLKPYEQPGKSLTVFVKTNNDPKWQIVSLEKGREFEKNIGVAKKEQLLVDGGVKQITFNGVGGEKTSFKEWFFYNGQDDQNISAADSIGLHTPPPPPPPKKVPVGSTIEFDLNGKGIKPYRKDATGWFQYTNNTFTTIQIGISNAASIKALEDAWRAKHP